MEETRIWGLTARVHRYDAIVIGSGCAGLNGADTLHSMGYSRIALITEGMNLGTSRNTGSDKQTYYKLAWQTGQSDNVRKMAQTLFSGGSVHGDLAYAEAANSVRCFMKLVNLGVPFPTNDFGEYAGYRTDHSTEERATSAGPLTSRYMTEALEGEVRRRGIPVWDQILIVELVRDENGILGAVGLDLREEAKGGLHIFLADNVLLATGGPAAVYQNRVYPASQRGMTGLAIRAGAVCENLQEWQYGIASVDFRWNLSGTYQQVVPRYVSVDEQGTEREFLYDYFEDPAEAMNMVFLKGYQWPFDSEKYRGSTLIDMIVYNEEIHLGRKVYLDYRSEPKALERGLDILGKEAREYLERSHSMIPTPIARLERMNPNAIALYLSHGIDLRREMLRITVAAQHCNGGVAVDADWQTSIPGLYAAGEVAATFGVRRPGGSALNSTQVGSFRAARHICKEKRKTGKDLRHFLACAERSAELFSHLAADIQEKETEDISPAEMERNAAAEMSAWGAQLRNIPRLKQTKGKIRTYLAHLHRQAAEGTVTDRAEWFRTEDMLTTAEAVVESILFAAERIGTRGGSVCLEKQPDLSGAEAIRSLKFRQYGDHDDQVLRWQWAKGCEFAPVRPLPDPELWFETVWAQYRRSQESERQNPGTKEEPI